MMTNKLPINGCRLCINIYDDHRCLYDENGRTNEVYALALKYFTDELLNVEWVRHLRNICMKCYRYLGEFNAYEQYVRRKHVQIYLGTELMNSLPENNEFVTDLQSSGTMKTLTKAHLTSTIRPIDNVTEKLCHNDAVASDRCIPQTSSALTSIRVSMSSQERENVSRITEQTGGVTVKQEDNLLRNDEYLNSLIQKSIETDAQTSGISISAGDLQITAHSIGVSQNPATVGQQSRDSIDSNVPLPSPVVIKTTDSSSEDESCESDGAGNEFEEFKNILLKTTTTNVLKPTQLVIKTTDSSAENESCESNGPGKDFEEFQDILPKTTTTNVLHPIQLVIKTTDSSAEDESCESDDTGAEILEFDEPVGVFAGGEFDETVENESENRSTISERYGEMVESVSEDRSFQLEWSGESCSSHDELPLAHVALKRNRLTQELKQSSITNSITKPKGFLQSEPQESSNLNKCQTKAALEANTSEEISSAAKKTRLRFKTAIKQLQDNSQPRQSKRTTIGKADPTQTKTALDFDAPEAKTDISLKFTSNKSKHKEQPRNSYNKNVKRTNAIEELQRSGESSNSHGELPLAHAALTRKRSTDKEKQSSIPNSVTKPKGVLQSKPQESSTLNECQTKAALEANTSEEISPVAKKTRLRIKTATKQLQDNSQPRQSKRTMMGEADRTQTKTALDVDASEGKTDISLEFTSNKSKHKEQPRNSYNNNLKRPNTVEEYDAFIAEWRPNLECELCHEMYLTFSNLLQHYAEQHPLEKCYIQCCQIKFYQRWEIEKHISYHRKPKAFKCELCYKCFATKQVLQEHTSIKHSANSQSNSLKCSQCSKRFLYKSSLRKHMKYHCGKNKKEIGRYVCHECGNAYKTSSILQKHKIKFHQGTRPSLKCTICDKIFHCVWYFGEHMNKHTGNTKKTCLFCPKTFVYSKDVYVHIWREHPQEWKEKKKEKAELRKVKKTYKCDYSSGNVYQAQLALKEHHAIHTEKSLYVCKFCTKEYKYSSSLSSHLKRTHNEKPKKKENKTVANFRKESQTEKMK